ncbi:helix-turn-helix transcriptional regulator [Streptomyces sp. 2MCAF27]
MGGCLFTNGARVSPRPDAPVPLFDPGRLADVRPTAAGLLLGGALRQRRDQCGITMKIAAKAINASVSKVSRLERAESPPDVRDVAALAAKYKLSADDRAQLEVLARRAVEAEWFEPFLDFTPVWMHRLMGLEAECAQLMTYEMKIVPGLLQTDDYARQIISNGLPVSGADQVEPRVRLREERQTRFFGQTQPPQAIFLLDESIIFRQVGSPKTMSGQLLKLLNLLDVPEVSIRFVPFDSTVVSNYASMTHLVFGTGGLPPMVYIEGNDDATYHSKTEDVERHVELMLRLSAEAAASRRESRSMLQRALERFSD